MEKGDKTDAADKDSRLTRIRKGEYFPAWQHEMAGLLKPMLAAEEAKERLAAALPLAALGHDEPALPVLRETVEEHPQHVAAVAGALPWLLWKDRKLLFDQIVAKSPNPQTLQVAATSMAAVPDRRAADSLWGLLKRDEADQTTAGIVHFALTRLYFSENPYDASQASLSARKRASEDLAPRATGGPRWQRLTALALLLSFDREKAGELARQALEEPLLDATRQADAFQIDLLSSATAAEAGRKAAEAIQSENLQIRKRALKYLTAGAQSLAAIGDHSFILPVDGALMEQGSAYSYSMRPILPQPPAGVKAEPLLPLLEDDDPLVAAQAGYLLVLLDRQEGLEPLLDYWRQRGPGTPELDRLLYRAVAYLDDDSYLPLLERIYEAADKEGYNASLPEFYWTIRSMTSRNVLRFRKRIREEVGMEKLQ